MDNLPNFNCKTFSLDHLAVIRVAGGDRVTFLQGQLTCDIRSIAEIEGSVAAFCNPKGRVVSTLFVIRTPAAFLLLVPSELLDKVYSKLKMYVLRSDVQLECRNSHGWVFGLDVRVGDAATLDARNWVERLGLADSGVWLVRLPWSDSRFIGIAVTEKFPDGKFAEPRCSKAVAAEWRYLDISSGMPWFALSQSELYIPQMLNIDRLGGISFNKGCYTGQEIVARTHYLGKPKRMLNLAECSDLVDVAGGLHVLACSTQESVGAVLAAEFFLQSTRLLVVMQASCQDVETLVLDDGKRTPIKLIPFQS